MDRKKKTRGDVILICAVLAAALAIFLASRLFRSGGSELYADVTVDGAEYARLPLSEDAELEIDSDGGGVNVLVVKDGRAYISEANCQNQICVGTGKVSEEGQIIVCLPHKVVVTIEAGK